MSVCLPFIMFHVFDINVVPCLLLCRILYFVLLFVLPKVLKFVANHMFDDVVIFVIKFFNNLVIKVTQKEL